MSTKLRRERERQELRDAMLRAALDLAAAEGWSAVTMRKVAERIEYSPGMIYEYFKGKEALFAALLCDGFEQLVAELEAAAAAAPRIDEQLPALARAYWRFAMENQALYQVMHGLDGVPFGPDDESPENLRLIALMSEALRSLDPTISDAELIDLIDIYWATLHGLVSLTLAEQLFGGPERGLALAEQAIRRLVVARRLSTS